jgi:hypothetical protein
VGEEASKKGFFMGFSVAMPCSMLVHEIGALRQEVSGRAGVYGVDGVDGVDDMIRTLWGWV